MHRNSLAAAALLAFALPAGLAGQVEVTVEGYGQFQFNTTSVDEDEAGAETIAWSTFETRRIRPTVSVEIDGWIAGTLQPDFALGDIALKDAFMNFALDDAFELRVGQFKKPFSRLELVSSTRILPIERELRIRGLEGPYWEEQSLLDLAGYKGRDIGLAAHGALGRVSYELGVFNGAGADSRDRNDGKSFAGRLQLRPSEALPLDVGAAVSHRETFMDVERSGTAFELSAEWGEFRREGLHVIAEAVAGDLLLLPDENLLGAQAWIAWFRPTGGGRVEGVEPLFRASFGQAVGDREDDTAWLFTPGVNLYFHGRNRVMLNWDLSLPAGDLDAEHALRAQAQLHF